MKNLYDLLGNRTRDLPICSAVPQPTAPQLVPELQINPEILQDLFLLNL